MIKFSIPLLLLAVAISPALARAQVGVSAENTIRFEKRAEVKNDKKIPAEGRVNAETKVRVQAGTEVQKRGTTSKASSTAGVKEKMELSRVKIFQLASGLQKNIAREITQAKNIIARLSGEGSVVAKLEASGVNTTAIKAKLSTASTLADKAQTELDQARSLIASSSAELKVQASSSVSVQTIRVKASEARSAMISAHDNVRLAIKNIMEARKMIGQIPGLKDILKTEASVQSTTTASTSITN